MPEPLYRLTESPVIPPGGWPLILSVHSADRTHLRDVLVMAAESPIAHRRPPLKPLSLASAAAAPAAAPIPPDDVIDLGNGEAGDVQYAEHRYRLLDTPAGPLLARVVVVKLFRPPAG